MSSPAQTPRKKRGRPAKSIPAAKASLALQNTNNAGNTTSAGPFQESAVPLFATSASIDEHGKMQGRPMRGHKQTPAINANNARTTEVLPEADKASVDKAEELVNAPERVGSTSMSDDDDEWEYKYHPTETETFYVTLDLTSSSIKQHSGPKQGESQLQIVDLHSKNPMVAYNGRFYTCEWSSIIGTELIFDPAKPSPGFLGISSALIVGKPTVVHADPTTLVSVEHQEGVSDLEGPLKLPVSQGDPIPRQNQARFLERLQAVKLNKGEVDEVTIYTGQRGYRMAEREEGKRPAKKKRKGRDELLG